MTGRSRPGHESPVSSVDGTVTQAVIAVGALAELRSHRADERACVPHAFGVRLAAEEAPAALLVPEASAELLQRSRDVAGPSPACECIARRLAAKVSVPWCKCHGELRVIAPLSVTVR